VIWSPLREQQEINLCTQHQPPGSKELNLYACGFISCTRILILAARRARIETPLVLRCGKSFAAIEQNPEVIRSLRIRFPAQRSGLNRSFLLRARFLPSFSLARTRATRRLSAAANKKGRKVIEKVEQPRSPACTCRGACRLYRHARPRDGYEHLDMFPRAIPIALSTKRHPSSFSLFEHCFSIRGAVSAAPRGTGSAC